MLLAADSAHAQQVDENGEEVFDPDEEEEEIFYPDEPDDQLDDVAGELDVGDDGRPQARSGPLAGYEKVEVTDRTIGFRDDDFSSVSIDAQGVTWVSTYQGRTYRSVDGGENWNEQTVLPEVKELWGFASQRFLLGHVRNPAVRQAHQTNLGPSGGFGADARSYQLLHKDPLGANRMGGEDGLSLDDYPSFDRSGGYNNPLQRFSKNATGSAGAVLGAGLSSRAPRLSLLLAVLRRPIANLSLQRLILTTVSRNTYVREITSHPTDKGKVFAATGFGLYKSSDDGQSWYRDFAGLTPAERWIGHVLPDPKDPKRVYMGTSRGLFMSTDGGESWSKNTKIPEIWINRIVIDPKDSKYVYVAGNGGVFRSSDYGANFAFIYYHSIRLRRDVQWMAIDPFDSNVAYLGTKDGLMRTRKLRTASITDWEVVAGLRTSNLNIGTVDLCTKHPGHVYIQTRADLPTINYGANGPESLLLESWDHGLSWRDLAGNQTVGDIQWFTLDPKNTDTVWIAFSRAVVELKREPDGREDSPDEVDPSEMRLSMGRPVLPDMPSMSQVIRAAMVSTELEMGAFVKRLDSLGDRNWLPSTFNITGGVGLWNLGKREQDIQFNGDRFLNVQDHRAWQVTAWMAWNLPDLLYLHGSNPMMRFRDLQMINGVRDRIMRTIHRNYGELQRVRAKQRYSPSKKLTTRVNMALRAQYLEALVDLAAGSYLTKWKAKAKQ